MKKFIFLMAIVLTMATTTSHAGWFSSNDDDDKNQQIDHLQYEVDMETAKSDVKTDIIIVLGIGVVVSLVVGAAIGSKARRAVNQ